MAGTGEVVYNVGDAFLEDSSVHPAVPAFGIMLRALMTKINGLN